MHFLDTDTMTHAHLGHRKVASRIEQMGEQNVATTIVTAIVGAGYFVFGFSS